MLLRDFYNGREGEEMKTIYDLELHEGLEVAKDFLVVRVPGGWLYAVGGLNTVFVPYAGYGADIAKGNSNGR